MRRRLPHSFAPHDPLRDPAPLLADGGYEKGYNSYAVLTPEEVATYEAKAKAAAVVA